MSALTSVVGGVVSALYPVYQFATGEVTGELWHGAVLRFAFANGCGTMIVCAFLVSVTSGQWKIGMRRREFLLWLCVSLVIISFAFNVVFDNAVNYAFMVYPVVIFAAVRYGMVECSLALVLVVAGIYTSLIRYGSGMAEDDVLPIIQFIQGFTWVLAVTGYFVAALVSERRVSNQKILDEKKRLLEMQLSRERAHLEALRYQINPHFLFNSINSVCAALPENPSDARTMLAEMAHYLRTVLDHPAEDFTTLGEELESLRAYIAIEERRYGEALRCEFTVDPGLGELPIPVFVLQPLVENAIRHGFASSVAAVHIEVRATVLDNASAVIEVANTGQWVETGEGEGIGLANIRKRLELLCGGRGRIEAGQVDGRVCVRMILPLTVPLKNETIRDESPDSR